MTARRTWEPAIAEHDAPRRPPIAILGSAPSYLHGLRAALNDHGWDLQAPSDIDGWCQQPGARILLVLLPATAGIDRAEHVRQPAGHDEVTVVALVADAIAEDHVALIRAGATTVIDIHAEPETIAHHLDALHDGQALLPLETLHRLAAIARSDGQTPVLADQETKWLALLAEGRTISEIARLGHLSERGLHRALQALYRRTGVANRDQAIVWATRHGIIE